MSDETTLCDKVKMYRGNYYCTQEHPCLYQIKDKSFGFAKEKIYCGCDYQAMVNEIGEFVRSVLELSPKKKEE